MTADVVPQYQAVQLDVARNFVRIILKNPQELGSHIKLCVSPLCHASEPYSPFLPDSTFAAIVMGAIYGIEIREPHDKYYHMVERMAEVGEEILIPGRFPVEAFPSLRYLPSWFPGGGFKKWAADAKRDILHTVDYLFDGAKSVVVSLSLRS